MGAADGRTTEDGGRELYTTSWLLVAPSGSCLGRTSRIGARCEQKRSWFDMIQCRLLCVLFANSANVSGSPRGMPVRWCRVQISKNARARNVRAFGPRLMSSGATVPRGRT